MRRVVLGVLALAAAGGAHAQPTTFDWWITPPPTGTQAAWAVKSEGVPGARPQLMMLVREAKPAIYTPGTDIRKSQMLTFDVDCAMEKARPIEIAVYSAYFDLSGTQTPPPNWAAFAKMGEVAAVAKSYCSKVLPAGQTPQRTDIAGAQRWLDAMIPKPKAPPAPPATSTFELVGRMSKGQPVDIWLDASTIKREGNLATAWTYEAWEGGWMKLINGKTNLAQPSTWRLHEIECGKTLRKRVIWFQTLNPDMTPARTHDENAAPFGALSAMSGANDSVLAQRVCNNKPLTFSAKYTGSASQLAFARYGAWEFVKVQAPRFQYPAVTRVDLGDTIRIRENDRTFTYEGTFERSGADNHYTGEFVYAGGQTGRAELTVKGISDGQLLIERSDREGAYGFPVTNGKAGKGVIQWARHRDDYSATLLEPAAITLKQ